MTESLPSTVHLHRDELPVTCPPEKAKWNLHPRVYLPVAKGASEVHCPYCGTRYVIVDDPSNSKQHKEEEV